MIGTMPDGLVLVGVTHDYGAKRAVDDVSLMVGTGEVVCLVGPSGCGKSTLLRIAAGLETLQAGRVLIDGCIIAEPDHVTPAERRGVGLMFQDNALFPHLTVAGNVAFGLDRWDAPARKTRVAEVLAQVGMADHAAAYPHQLSGGQQQRVALARALAPRPRVMLLDEPFANLDARLREQVRDDTLHVLKHAGTATLMVTHDPEEAMFMADRIAVMHAGRVEQQGTPAEVYGAPASPFVAGFFGQVNAWTGVVRDGAVETPLGRIPARGLADGDQAEIVIRPEGVRLRDTDSCGPDGPAIAAKVLTARLLGRSSWIHLCVGGPDHGPHEGEAGHPHFHARVHGRYLPPEGDVLGVEIDPAQTFVFRRRVG